MHGSDEPLWAQKLGEEIVLDASWLADVADRHVDFLVSVGIHPKHKKVAGWF